MVYLVTVWQGIITIALLLLVVLAIAANLLLRKLHALAKARSHQDGAARLLVFHNNGYIAAHRQALATGDTSSPTISHSLSHAAQSMFPRGFRGPGAAVMCSIAVGADYFKSVEPCLESHKRYAAHHGLHHVLVTEQPTRFERPIPWMKISLIARMLTDGYQRIFFIDADAMITNSALSVDPYFETLERTGKALLLTEDARGVNTGVMFVSNRPEALRLMDMIWRYDLELNHATWEQHAVNVLLNTFPEFRAPFEIDPAPRHFNSFPAERRQFIPTGEDQIWASGDFVCHFCGIRRQHLTDLIRHYAELTGADSEQAAVSKNPPQPVVAGESARTIVKT